MTYDEAKTLLTEHYSEGTTRTIIAAIAAHEREKIARLLGDNKFRLSRGNYYGGLSIEEAAAFVRRGKP